jgi:hypothetical protein
VILTGGRRMTYLVAQMRLMPSSIAWLIDLMAPQMAEQGNSCCLFGGHQQFLLPNPRIISVMAESKHEPRSNIPGPVERAGGQFYVVNSRSLGHKDGVACHFTWCQGPRKCVSMRTGPQIFHWKWLSFKTLLTRSHPDGKAKMRIRMHDCKRRSQ